MYASNGHELLGLGCDSDGERVIRTPDTSDDDTSDELIATPTSSASTIIHIGRSTISNSSSTKEEEEEEEKKFVRAFPFLRAPIPLRAKMETSLKIGVDEEDERSAVPLLASKRAESRASSVLPLATCSRGVLERGPQLDTKPANEGDVSSLTPQHYKEPNSESNWDNGAFDANDIKKAISRSKNAIIEEEQQLIDIALRQSLAALPVCEYQPATREQHRIMSAYTEDLSAERAGHSKEDDEFFSEILDDTVESEEDDGQEEEEEAEEDVEEENTNSNSI
jgi:hypothetical protein